ncbi:MAG TPA: hypothetical protein DCE80_10205 [Ignavibacteriales bacterium]|nr:hypothetical protein [Ignavibacteriales bacterium]
MKKLTQKRIKFLVDNFFEQPDIDYSLFDSIQNREELHFIAEIFNWDYDIELLKRIINNPICDKGTALLIYWLSCPGFYTQFDSIDEVDINPEVFELIKEIENNFNSDFYKCEQIAFDPTNDKKFGNIAKSNGEEDGDKWHIDKKLFKPTNGKPFPKYEWKSSKMEFAGTPVSQGQANANIEIIIDENPDLIPINKNEIENELKFPIELKGKEYEYSDSWSAHFRIGVNRKGDLSKICLLVADNSLVINNSKGIAKLKFVPIETLDDEQIEVNLEVKFSVASFSNNEPNLRIVK